MFVAAGKVHGSLARAGKVRGQTPKVAKADKKKNPKGRAAQRIKYNRRFVNVGAPPNPCTVACQLSIVDGSSRRGSCSAVFSDRSPSPCLLAGWCPSFGPPSPPRRQLSGAVTLVYSRGAAAWGCLLAVVSGTFAAG